LADFFPYKQFQKKILTWGRIFLPEDN
jgi:hypothetical protein